jgi:hypothetical protein
MPKCAFCDYNGKLTREHITSQWIRDLFPGRIKARRFEADGSVKKWEWDALDYKARVVCGQCNHGWMNDLENGVAKPALTPLITGKFDIPIGLDEAEAIALFAFKNAVVIDHAERDREPFFSDSERADFREQRLIPGTVGVWICPYAGNRPNGRIKALYHELSATNRLQLYVFTFALGNLTIQLVGAKEAGTSRFRPAHWPEGLGELVWPTLPAGLVWPGEKMLIGDEAFNGLANRWLNIEVFS